MEVYLDNNATTRPDPAVVDAMLLYLRDYWGNPSSVHPMGQRTRAAVDEARAQVARLVGCRDAQITFTGGGTEATVTAVSGLWRRRPEGRRAIVTSPVEHAATREALDGLREVGAEIREVSVDADGVIDVGAAVEAVTRPDVAILTLLWANNESGVVQDVAPVVAAARSAGVFTHLDATQAVGKIPTDFATLGCDTATAAAHKFHGPKGVGTLYTRRGLVLRPLIPGGPQERGRRGGTENVAGIVGTGVAAVLAADHLPRTDRIGVLRDDFETRLLAACDDPEVVVFSRNTTRLPNTTLVGFGRVSAEAMLIMLGEKGVYASSGAACSSGSVEPSHVLLAAGVPEARAQAAVRFSLSRFTTADELDHALAVVPDVYRRLTQVMA